MILHPEARRRRVEVHGTDLQDPLAWARPPQEVQQEKREKRKEVAKAIRAEKMPMFAKPTRPKGASTPMNATISFLHLAGSSWRSHAATMRTRANLHTCQKDH